MAATLWEDLDKNQPLAWLAYQSSLLGSDIVPKAITVLLTMFREHANTPAMIRHAMMLIKKHTEYQNSGQTPVMTVDQPLYALAREIQWSKSYICSW